MSFWACQIQPNRVRLALHLLQKFGYSVYYPLIPGKRLDAPVGLFPGYAFVLAIEHWYTAHRCPGVRRLILDGERPAVIADTVVEGIRKREGRDGLVKLPKARGLQPGAKLRVLRGPFEGKLATLHSGMNGHQRVTVLLSWLGGERRVTLPRDAVRAVGTAND